MALEFSAPFTERTPRVVNAAKLHRAAARKKAQRFLIEGENAVDAAVSTGAATDVFVTERAAQRFPQIVSAAGYLDVYVHPITEKAAQRLADTATPSGLFAVCRPVLWSAGKILSSKPQLIAVGVETADPGNAGTIVRTADAMGADGVIFAGESVDPLGAKVVRSSAGSLFHLPVAREPNIKDVLGQIRAAGMQILATAADGALTLAEADLSKPTAWLLGNEAHGLGAWLAEAEQTIRIPIRGRAESLNVAIAASICLYESAQAQSA